ncbi:MAG: hypothetical protein ACP5UQ_13785 [Anaerolineae bacterium]
MSGKTNQLPKGGKAAAVPPSRRNALPLLVAAGALLLVALGLVLLARPGRPSTATVGPTSAVNAPRLAVDRTVIDFGKVPLDIPVKATFRLSNVGDRPLAILNQPVVEVKQGC